MTKIVYPVMLTDENDAGTNIVITSKEKLKEAITYFYGGEDVTMSRHYDDGDSMVKVQVYSNNYGEHRDYFFWIEEDFKVF